MMKLEEMRDRKREENYSYEDLAHLTGFSVEKIRKTLENEEKSTDYARIQCFGRSICVKAGDYDSGNPGGIFDPKETG